MYVCVWHITSSPYPQSKVRHILTLPDDTSIGQHPRSTSALKSCHNSRYCRGTFWSKPKETKTPYHLCRDHPSTANSTNNTACNRTTWSQSGIPKGDVVWTHSSELPISAWPLCMTKYLKIAAVYACSNLIMSMRDITDPNTIADNTTMCTIRNWHTLAACTVWCTFYKYMGRKRHATTTQSTLNSRGFKAFNWYIHFCHIAALPSRPVLINTEVCALELNWCKIPWTARTAS